MWKNLIALTRINKPIGILLLLYPTLWGVWLAGAGKPALSTLVVFVLGVVLMRSAGCIINDYADRAYDPHVERTKMRPLATGVVSVRVAFMTFFILISLAFLLVLTQNHYTIALSFVGLLLAIVYPFLKRMTHLPQVGLGFAFSWGVPMAFAAEQNVIPLAGWILFGAAVLWPVIYDTMYAMTDKTDDLRIGVKSTAILFGSWDRCILAILQVIFILSLVWVGYLFHLHWVYYISLIVASLFSVYQQYLIRNRDPQASFKAFLNNHYLGLSVFLGIVLSYLL